MEDGDRGRVLCLVRVEGQGLLAEVDVRDLLIGKVGDARGQVAAGAADCPGAVDAGGADEVVAPPQAAAMTAMLARMPKSRFCMDSPPNGWLTR